MIQDIFLFQFTQLFQLAMNPVEAFRLYDKMYILYAHKICIKNLQKLFDLHLIKHSAKYTHTHTKIFVTTNTIHNTILSSVEGWTN